MQQYKYILIVTVFFFSFSSLTSAQTGCDFPDPIQLTEEGGCGGALGLPENPDWEEMEQNGTGGGLGGDDVIFGNDNGEGTEVGDIQDEVNNNPDDFPPTSGSSTNMGNNIVNFGNMASSNVDMGELIDCINVNCIFANLPAFSIEDFNLVISEMDPAEFNDIMANAGNGDVPSGYDNWEDVFNDPNNVPEIESAINTEIGGWDYNNMAETFYGQSNIPETDCGGSFQLTQGSEENADLDLFSETIPGLEHSGNDKLLPSPSAMNIIKNIQTGVDLYNGLPSAGASLHTLSSNDLSVDVGLSYKGGGIRVDDYGSDVGTSWDLSAGGQISRVVSGLPDEFNGNSFGGGMGPIDVLKPCVTVSGGGINWFLPHKRVQWSPFEPQKIKFYVDVATGVIVIPLPFFVLVIPWYVSIEITTEINVRSKPGHINYEEIGLGYLKLNTSDMTNDFDQNLSPLQIEGFLSIAPELKEKYLRNILSKKPIDDVKFLSPMVETALGYWDGINNLFGDEEKTLKRLDLEPDEFFYSFGGYSGKFVFDQNGGIYTIPHSDLLIEKNMGNIGGQEHIISFSATTPEGLVYHFGGGTDAVDLSSQTNYTLPNEFTYPVGQDGDFNGETSFETARIDESSFPFSGMVLCYPRRLVYGATYEKNYTVMNSPKYVSTWHLKRIESLMTGEQILFDYTQTPELHYYSQKSLSHDFPNFDAIGDGGTSSDGELKSETNFSAAPGHLIFNTEWQNGKASLVYSATENHIVKSKLASISGQRGTALVFDYTEQRPDIVGDRLLKEITLNVNGVFSKSWVLSYEKPPVPITIDCDPTVPTDVPVYSSAEEFKIELGSKYPKFPYPVLRWLHVYSQVAFTPPFPNLNIPLPLPPYDKEESHHSVMSEFGSLVQIKHYEDENSLNIELEQAKFQAEAGRAFLLSIKEKDRANVLHDFLDLEYYGDLERLPKRFSLNQDLWGYNNNNEESMSLLPELEYNTVFGVNQDIGNHQDLKEHFSFNNPLATVGMYSGHNETAVLDMTKVGALRQILLPTGGTRTFDYEQNEWPSNWPDITTGVIPGAGLRVLSLIENPIEGVSKTTTYSYDIPTIVNLPIRIANHDLNKTTYNIEKNVRTSTGPFNRWFQNKNHYVGYGTVTEAIAGGGSIEHSFTTPIDYPPTEPEIYRLNRTMRGILPFTPDEYNNYLYGTTQKEPFPMLLVKDWRYGLEKDIITRNADGATVQEVHNEYAFDLEELRIGQAPPSLKGVRTHLFQRNYPGDWLLNKLFGELVNAIPVDSDLIGTFVGAFNFYSSIDHPFRKIYKDYLYSVYNYELEQVRLISSDVNIYYPENGTSQEITTVNSYEGYPVSYSVYHRLKESTADFHNGQTMLTRNFYAGEMTPAASKMDQAVLTELEEMGLAGYGAPLRVENYENDVNLNSGSISAMGKNGDVFVPTSNWTVRNGIFVLNGQFIDWNSAGKPTVYEKAEFGTAEQVSGYEFMSPQYIFSWSPNLKLELKTIGLFSKSYGYNAFEELAQYTDVNGIVSTFSYDDWGKLETRTSRNGTNITRYSYGFQPNFLSSTTSFTDELPEQGSIISYNGFGMPISTIRNDGAELETITYDQLFRISESTVLGNGTTTFSYEASPIGRPVSIVDAVGNTILNEYLGTTNSYNNAFSELIITEDNANVVTSRVVEDAFSRTLIGESGEGGITQYIYDPQGRLTQVDNPMDESYIYDYNLSTNKIISKTVPGGGETKLWYDERFRLAISLDAEGNAFVREYDDLNRIIGVYHYDDGSVSGDPSGLVDSDDMATYFNPSNLILEQVFANGRTWLESKRERILKEGVSNVFKNTENNLIDDFGQVLVSKETYPTIGIVDIIYDYNDAGLLKSMDKTIIGPESVTSNYTYTYNDLLFTEETLLDVNNTGDQLISLLEYNSKDQLKIKNIGAVASGGYLQNVNYFYDEIGRLTQINSPANSECAGGDIICELQAEVVLENPPNGCQFLESIEIEGQVYNVEPPLDLLDNQSNMATVIAAALDVMGFLGEVTEEDEVNQEGYLFTVTISNTNVDEVTLFFQSCNTPITFEIISCCETAAGPTGSGSTSGNNLDLYYQSIAYEGLDVSRIEISSGCNIGLMRNDFTYDHDHRVTMMENTFFNPNPITNRYSTSYSYNLAGGLENLTRKGLLTDSPTEQYGEIDQLIYNNNIGTGRLDGVTDGASQEKGAISTTYLYDDNGNMTDIIAKNLGITYNSINLPEVVTNNSTGDKIKYEYTYGGEKIRKFVLEDNVENNRYYLGGVEYNNGEAIFYSHEEGRVVTSTDVGIGLSWEYQITDHLGNVVVFFDDKDSDGIILTESDTQDPEIQEVLQRNIYYPFGMEMEGPWELSVSAPENKYIYNGKEMQSDLGLDWLDYGARMYDPSIGRWNAVDPLAESYYSYSPYNYTLNNPIRFIDPDGRSVDIINPVDKRSQAVYDEYYSSASPEKQKELDALDASATVYHISVSSDHSSGRTKPGKLEYEILLNVEDVGEYSVGILADELTHASQIESGDLGYDEKGFLDAYDLQDEVDSKLAAIEALDKKGLKMQDTPTKKEGEISAKFGELYDETGGNPTDKQVEKWSKTKNKAGDSYNKLFKSTGGSTKMGVRKKAKNKF